MMWYDQDQRICLDDKKIQNKDYIHKLGEAKNIGQPKGGIALSQRILKLSSGFKRNPV